MRFTRGRALAIGAAAVIIGGGLAALVATSDFMHDRGLWVALDLVIGWSFVGVGLFAWYRRPDNRVGALMVLTGFAFYLNVMGGVDPDVLFTLGNLLQNVFVATAIHLVLAFPTGRLETRIDRLIVGFGYLTTTLGFIPFAAFVEPATLGCTNCPDNVFLIHSDPGFALSWLDGLSLCGVLLAVPVVTRLVQRWREASPPLRRIVTPVFLGVGLLYVTLAVLLAMYLLDIGSDQLKMVLFYSALVPFALVPFLFLAGLLKGRMLRGRGVGALVRRLGAGIGPREVRPAIAEALGDPSVELVYWLSSSHQYVDAEGRPVLLPPGRAVTEVEREGRRIGGIVHDPALLDDQEYVRAAGAAAALALENGRLEAELRAKVEELRASRMRLVEVGLSQRRRLERDLHDGAQQRLVSLALTLRLAREKLNGGAPEAERLLDRSRDELEEALKELRELARGIHPAVLSDRGLAAAVEALAHRAPLPVELGELPARRYPEHVELAAYFVISEALTNVAKYASASYATVTVAQTNGRLTVEVGDDGIGGASVEGGTGLRGLAARLESIEGRLDVESKPGHGTILRASIPCE